jgi:metal-sulfur cluster biosynthetic enzyme
MGLPNSPIPAEAGIQDRAWARVQEDSGSPLSRERAEGKGNAPRLAEARAALDTVLDPELDEPVTALGFVGNLVVAGDTVAVTFRLPTAWCSLNFAWIMAEDMRDALLRLDWVRRADIRLIDHFAARKINAGIAAGQDFAAAFGDDAGGSLAALRDTFRRKAYLGRMATLIGLIRKTGRDDPAIARLTIAGLDALSRDAGLGDAVDSYLALRSVYGGPAEPSDAAFRDADGAGIPDGRLADFLRDIRMRRRGVEANGEMCKVMLKVRYGEPDEPAASAATRA